MLGGRPDEIVGHVDTDFFGPTVGADILNDDRRILATGKPMTYETRRKVADSDRVFFTTKVPYTDPDTGEQYIMGISRDITGKDGLERQLAMDDQYASVGALAGGIAHEINNPLTYVLSGIESVIQSLSLHRQALDRLEGELAEAVGPERAAVILARAGLDQVAVASAIERAHEAHHGSERVRDIVRGLSSFARPTNNTVSSVDIHTLLDSAIKMASVELRYRARIVREYGELPMLRGQEQQLRQLFLNLLICVARSLPEGDSDAHEIRIVTSASADEICVEVLDSAPESEGESARELGMSIVRYVVAAHRGVVRNHERQGGMNRLTIHLPIEPLSSPKPRAPKRAAEPAPPRARILIVDDEPLIRMLLRRMLGRQHEVEEAESGVDAVELIESGAEFDAILCDLMMPRMTGIDVYDWLRDHRPELLQRIGFVTGGAFTERGQEFLQHCDRPVLEKPFDRKGVQSLLEKLAGSQG